MSGTSMTWNQSAGGSPSFPRIISLTLARYFALSGHPMRSRVVLRSRGGFGLNAISQDKKIMRPALDESQTGRKFGLCSPMESQSSKKRQSSSRRRRQKQKPRRVWLGQFSTTAQATGQESQRGYGSPRRKWDSESALDREQRLRESVSPQPLSNITAPEATRLNNSR